MMINKAKEIERYIKQEAYETANVLILLNKH